ncbi:single-stranded-DNA-specific exonuclease RecJ [Rubrobacter marinus]|uniref:single-stranded-DNA-specific exonuclease RecJ n=1 Tax=Rubrobacter marinus TaxID=2653852 RepID=UPI00140B0BE7|nr:DHH family phosphoesterase [Rubrobacter marinus]
MAEWRLLEPGADVVAELKRAAEVDELCARVLANRGVDAGAALGFLSPSLKAIGAPEEEAWRVAARRVARAVRGGERIGIFGDYDTDGITSSAVLYLALSRYTNNLAVKLPTRQTGYGLLEPYVRDLFADGVDLVVTADCGISNRAGVEIAASLGMDVIVTDHHIPPEERPEAPPAVAVLDPKLWNMEDPLAGVGVAWKLAWAVAREMGDPDGRKHLGRLLDLVALGTIVDIAPLVGDNRALASMGLKHMNRALEARAARPGLGALVKVAGVRGSLDEGDLGWKLGPRINSIGRIKHPGPALDLLLTDDSREAMRLAFLLNQMNSDRQQRTRYAVERAMEGVDPSRTSRSWSPRRGCSAGSRARRRQGRGGDGEAGGRAEPARRRLLRRVGAGGGDGRGPLRRPPRGSPPPRGVGGHRKAAGLSVKAGAFDAFVAGVNEAVRAQTLEEPEILTPRWRWTRRCRWRSSPTGCSIGTRGSRRSGAGTTGPSS